MKSSQLAAVVLYLAISSAHLAGQPTPQPHQAQPQPRSSDAPLVRPTDETECSAEELKLPFCAHPIVNASCRIEIDKDGPVAPIPLRLLTGAKACIVVSKKLASENILFEPEYKDSPAPDPFLAIATALTPNLKAFTARITLNTGLAADAASPLLSAVPSNRRDSLDSRYIRLEKRLASLTAYQSGLRSDGLELKAKLTQIENGISVLKKAKAQSAYEEKYGELCAHPPCLQESTLPPLNLAAEELRMIVEEFAQLRADTHLAVRRNSSQETAADADMALQSDVPAVRMLALEKLLPASRAALDEIDRIERGIAEATDNQRLLVKFVQALEKSQTGINDALEILPLPANAKWEASYVVRPAIDDKDIRARGAQRSASVKLTSQDKVSKEKKPLTSVTVAWGSTRWELSTGLLFSNSRSRTFANTVQLAAGAPQNYRVTQSASSPTVVPSALIHYRIWETGARQRFAILATGAAGVNTNSTTADFGGGLSFGWRNFVLSFLLHGARELYLSGGYAVGLELTSGTPAPTTERHWVGRGAIGISYRIPIP